MLALARCRNMILLCILTRLLNLTHTTWITNLSGLFQKKTKKKHDIIMHTNSCTQSNTHYLDNKSIWIISKKKKKKKRLTDTGKLSDSKDYFLFIT